MSENNHEPCWYHKYRGDPCLRPARWQTGPQFRYPACVATFYTKVRWCDDHRHSDDALITAAEVPQKGV